MTTIHQKNHSPAPAPRSLRTRATGLVDVTDGSIEFVPVPRHRQHRNGWTPGDAFIAALSRCGRVARAARAVGMTRKARTAPLEAEGACSFAEAWDPAEGFARNQIAARSPP